MQEILNNWQSYRSEEKRLNEWLAEKENNLKDVSQVDFGDKMALSLQLQQLKVCMSAMFLTSLATDFELTAVAKLVRNTNERPMGKTFFT